MIGRGVYRYVGKVRLFRPNARLYLLNLVISSVAFGVYALLFNFYVLSLGYDEALLGRLLSANSTAALIGAVPAGYASDRLGRKVSLLISGLVTALAVAGMVVWSNVPGLVAMNVLMGLAQSLGAVTLAPFLMENSGDEERTYLFSFTFSLQMIVGMVGFWIGGRLPGWLAGAAGSVDNSPVGYTWALVAVAGLACLSLAPLLFMRLPAPKRPVGASPLAPFRYARQHPSLLGKLTSPVLVTSLGAGLFVPFMNVFFRNSYHVDDATIGSLFAAGSLVMGLGFLVGAPLADRYGKIKLVVLTQILFIPSLVLLGFAPWFWLSAAAYLVRVVLMTMDDPIYQTFVMERVEENARATVASLLSMAWSFGWAAGPTISGWLQVEYGFAPVFLSVIATYIIAIYLTLRFFVWQKESVAEIAGAAPAAQAD
ncbi:MAG TPA: MFS transporter [Anaerolineae bacterium]